MKELQHESKGGSCAPMLVKSIGISWVRTTLKPSTLMRPRSTLPYARYREALDACPRAFSVRSLLLPPCSLLFFARVVWVMRLGQTNTFSSKGRKIRRLRGSWASLQFHMARAVALIQEPAVMGQ